jgi:hypothetical protein
MSEPDGFNVRSEGECNNGRLCALMAAVPVTKCIATRAAYRQGLRGAVERINSVNSESYLQNGLPV